MDLAAFAELMTPAGQEALAAAAELEPTPETLLAGSTSLRKRFSPSLVRTVLATAMLRRKARAKFGRADAMYFTREALEQASGEMVSRYRAGRFAPFAAAGDFCCGVGGDAISLAEGRPIVAVDADPLRLALAELNLAAYGLRDRATFLAGDLLTTSLPDVPAAFFDPDRRADGRRHVSIAECQPPLDALRARLPRDFPLGVKLAPAVPWEELAAYDAEVEFISADGELKECVLWFGPLRTVGRRATVLPDGATLAADAPAATAEPGPPLAYLYDPDPAVVRSGLVADLGEQIGARPIDREIAYLTSDELVPTPFARAYRVEESLPFHARNLAERLRAMRVGRVTVLRRGNAVDPMTLVRQLKLNGPEERAIVLTRVVGRPAVLIARAVAG